MRLARHAVVVAILLAVAGWAWWRFLPETLPRFVVEAAGRAQLADPPLYKWRDAKGQWHITDEPPKDRPYEEVNVDPRMNVVPTVVPGRTEPPE